MTEIRDSQLLDNPAWAALTGLQVGLGEGGALARRFLPEVSPFAGVGNFEPESLSALGSLLGQGECALLICQQPLPTVDIAASYLFDVLQMVDATAAAGEADVEASPLSAADAGDMLALAEQTKPGPFGPRTGDMGSYIGIRRDGLLVAMAGERLRFGNFVEISGVCVAPALRGQGVASRLINRLRRDIRQRGGVPFLHVRSDAPATARLYEGLGFAARATFKLYSARRAS
ncbi:GNAT family N-acetyltransferase [Escherichia coli]|nr:GNAT family N-acetyltransferase [Escherichia coli]EFG8199752.1 GNAT family N-acetyltransferase [Escherichia coli]